MTNFSKTIGKRRARQHREQVRACRSSRKKQFGLNQDEIDIANGTAAATRRSPTTAQQAYAYNRTGCARCEGAASIATIRAALCPWSSAAAFPNCSDHRSRYRWFEARGHARRDATNRACVRLGRSPSGSLSVSTFDPAPSPRWENWTQRARLARERLQSLERSRSRREPSMRDPTSASTTSARIAATVKGYER